MQGRNSRGSSSVGFFVKAGLDEYPSRKLIDDFKLSALIKRLEANADVATLDFSFSNLGDEGAILLAKSLRNNTNVTTLKLADSRISDQGLAAIVVMLKTNKTILEVDVSRNLFNYPALLEKLALSLKLNDSIQQAASKRVQLK